MFGFEIEFIPLFILIPLELGLLMLQIFNVALRSKDDRRKRFLVLIFVFIQYNVFAGFFPDTDFDINLILQKSFTYVSGIALAGYYFYFLSKEFRIHWTNIFNIKFLVISLSLFILVYLLATTLVSDSKSAEYIFVGFASILAVYYCYQTVVFLFKKYSNSVMADAPFKTNVFLGSIGIIFIASMPLTELLGDNYQTFHLILVNIALVLSTIGYFKSYFYEVRIENEILNGIKKRNLKPHLSEIDLKSYKLTSRQTEILYMILKDLPYKIIAEEIFITEKSVGKQASNIFKKVGCSNKKELIDLLSA